MDETHKKGIIQKQGIINVVITYVGFIFGFLNVLVLYPILFSKEQFGLTRLYNDLGATFSAFASLGVTNVIPRFLPHYVKDKTKDLMPIILLVAIIGSILLIILTFIFREQILNNYCEENVLFRQYAYLIVFIGVFNVLFTILSTYSNCCYNTNIVFLMSQLFNRAYPTLLLIGVYFKVFGFYTFMHLLALLSMLQVIAILISLYKNNLLDFNYQISVTTKSLMKSMIIFAGSIYFMVIIDSLSGSIQVFTISDMKGIDTTAIFVVAAYISQIIQIPQRSIAAIATPIVSTAWHNEDYKKIQSIYRKSSVNMNVIGCFLFLIICINIQNIFTLIGKGYNSGMDIAIFMGVAYLIDVSFGINNEIISTSKYWKLNFLTHFLLLSIMIPINYFFIKKFGAIGSAYALIISLSIYNVIRMLFLYIKFKMNPFTLKMLFLTVYVLTVLFFSNHFLNDVVLSNRIQIVAFVVLKTCIGILLFFIPVIYFNVSEEVNDIWEKFKLRIANF